jgi:hypothetical protein
MRSILIVIIILILILIFWSLHGPIVVVKRRKGERRAEKKKDPEKINRYIEMLGLNPGASQRILGTLILTVHYLFFDQLIYTG